MGVRQKGSLACVCEKEKVVATCQTCACVLKVRVCAWDRSTANSCVADLDRPVHVLEEARDRLAEVSAGSCP